MSLVLLPSQEEARAIHDAGRPQVVWTRLIDDLETPVSAYLKLGHGRPYAFLYESVEGGAWRGRYSIITLDPDLVWRSLGDKAEMAEGEAVGQNRFTPVKEDALTSLRKLAADCRFDLPSVLPPMASGLFGVLGYDMIRLVEPLGPANPDPLNLPDAVMTRPSLVAVFDAIAQEIIVCTTIWPKAGFSFDAAWKAASASVTRRCARSTRSTIVAPSRAMRVRRCPTRSVMRGSAARVVATMSTRRLASGPPR